MKALAPALAAFVLLLVCGPAGAQDSVPVSRIDQIYGPYAWVVRDYARTLLNVGVVLLVALPFQWLLPAVRRRAKFRSYEFWLDIVYASQGVWLSLLSMGALITWMVSAIYGTERAWFPMLSTLPFWAQVLLGIWAFDFLVYWRHRLEHVVPALWSFHAVHHTAEKVDVLTTTRLHPLEVVFGALFNAIVIRMGFAPAAVGLAFAIYLYYNYYIHTNVRIRYPGFLKYLFVSPFMHQWHHAKDAAAAGKNLGVVFAFHEWLFGTAYHPGHWPSEFGLSGPAAERVPQSYIRQTLYPLQYLFAKVVAWREQRAAKAAATI
ncbi:MAG TPA: sterol desaturase family protein [Burkholderiales bacterium]|nr:sterol desaturase family protein [Burkholderiales bacterium]